MKILAAVVTLLAAAPALASVRPPADLIKRSLLRNELPHVEGEEWRTLQNGIEFLPAADLSPVAEMHMRRLTTGNNGFHKVYVDGTETYYDEYAQAWRALGFYIDCDYAENNAARQLQEAVDGDLSCKRMMLWAAYVDEKYQGNGAKEYLYYDRTSGKWDDQDCFSGDSTRCVKMDCHLASTHYSLLGFFKEPAYGDWMDQLFTLEGDCVWTDDEYEFMLGNRDVWPDQCTETGITDSTGTAIYYDVKPSKYGEFMLGLYNDTSCIHEYKGGLSLLQVTKMMSCTNSAVEGHPCSTAKTNYNDAVKALKSKGIEVNATEATVWELASNLDEWNSAFDVFKQCQPCKAYDLTNIVAGVNYIKNANGTRYDNQIAGEDQEVFRCHNVGNYANVNQRMKFKTETNMWTARWTDVELAIEQGTIDDVPEVKSAYSPFSKVFKNYGYAVQQQRKDTTALVFAWIFVTLSAVIFGFSLFRFCAIKDDAGEIQEPLMASEKCVTA